MAYFIIPLSLPQSEIDAIKEMLMADGYMWKHDRLGLLVECPEDYGNALNLRPLGFVPSDFR